MPSEHGALRGMSTQQNQMGGMDSDEEGVNVGVGAGPDITEITRPAAMLMMTRMLMT